jgi:hypothetical protein
MVTLPTVELIRQLSGRVVRADLFTGIPVALRPALASRNVLSRRVRDRDC